MKTYGFIGCGNMGQALLRRMLSSSIAEGENVYVSRKNQEALIALSRELGVHAVSNEKAAGCDCVILAVKPQQYDAILHDIRHVLRPDAVLIYLAPGIDLSIISEKIENPMAKLVRLMPNTPCMIGQGVLAVCYSEYVNTDEKKETMKLFSCMGLAEEVPEKLMNAVVGISGSSPAYVYMFIDALADAGVRAGMPRAMAQKFAAKAVSGSANMVLETGEHPAVLKDQVCSPGGTTIEAVASLEKDGFRKCVLDAVQVCIEKSNAMKK